MFKEKLEKFKEKLQKKEEGNNKKTIENLVIFAIILIVTIVAINYIWSGDSDKKEENNEITKKLATEQPNTENKKSNEGENTEERLENILSNIKGVGTAKVLLTYSQTSQIMPMYDEDSTESTTEEKDSGGGTRIINESSTKKDIIYEENNGVKTPITQSVVNPKIEGAIITAQGAGDANVKANIIQAVEAVTGLATYKIQVFEMKGEN